MTGIYPRKITSLISRRDEFGVIVTVREQSSGKLFSFHEPGLVREALEAIAEKIDYANERSGGDWKVICYSTPRTVERDMQASREQRNHPGSLGSNMKPLEAEAMSRIGRLDLLDPSLRRDDERKYRRREE